MFLSLLLLMTIHMPLFHIHHSYFVQLAKIGLHLHYKNKRVCSCAEMSYAISLFLTSEHELIVNDDNPPKDAFYVRVISNHTSSGISKRTVEIQKETTKIIFSFTYSNRRAVTSMTYEVLFNCETEIAVIDKSKEYQTFMRLRNFAGDLDKKAGNTSMTFYELYRYVARSFSYYQG